MTRNQSVGNTRVNFAAELGSSAARCRATEGAAAGGVDGLSAPLGAHITHVSWLLRSRNRNDAGSDYCDERFETHRQGVAMKRKIASVVVLLCLVVVNWQVTAQQTPDWGSGVASFAFALIGDMPTAPSGDAIRQTGCGSIGTMTSTSSHGASAGPEQRQRTILHHSGYQHSSARSSHTEDNEWTDCHR